MGELGVMVPPPVSAPVLGWEIVTCCARSMFHLQGGCEQHSCQLGKKSSE